MSPQTPQVFFCITKKLRQNCSVLINHDVIQLCNQDLQVLEEYRISDIFGCTIIPSTRHSSNNSNANAVYLNICCYPRQTSSVLCVPTSRNKYRQKLKILLQVSQHDSNAENEIIAFEWRSRILSALHNLYPQTSASLASNRRKMMVVVNPNSGQGKGIHIFKKKVGPVLLNCGIDLELFTTEYAGHAKEKFGTMDLSKLHGLITIGGDGILYEVVNGILSRDDAEKCQHIPFGVIPGGSGNGLARSLAHACGESRDYLKDPIKSCTLSIARGRVQPVNLMTIETDNVIQTKSFLSFGLGLLGDIDIESETLRWMGEPRYTLWAFYRVANLRKYSVKLSYTTDEGEQNEVDGGTEFVLIHSCWVSHIGTDIHFAPSSKLGDGTIHLVYVTAEATRMEVVNFLLTMENGTHISSNSKHVKYVKVREFCIDCGDNEIPGHPTIDGELCAGKKISVKTSENKLNMFC